MTSYDIVRNFYVKVICLIYSTEIKLNPLHVCTSIGVIYGGTRDTGTRTFWTEGYSTPTFQDEKVNYLLSPAASRCDLRRLSYNKTIFGGALLRTPLGELTMLFQTLESDEEGDTSSPFFSPFASGPKGASYSF